MKKINHFLLILIFLLVVSCKTPVKEEKIRDRDNFKTRVVETENYQIPVRGSGILSSKTQSNLSFMTGGVIRKINTREGSKVKKGTVLAELDLTEIESRVVQASLANEKAVRDHTRIKALFADSVATLETLQNMQTAIEIAESNLRIAQFNMEYSKITAPANGMILQQLKEVNEIAAPGHPVFVFASTESDWILKISLSDRDAVRINPGDSAVISFDAYPGKNFAAEVSEIANAANLLNGTFEAELRLKELPRRLVTGLIGSALIYSPQLFFPKIPYISLVEASGSNAIVYLIINNRPVRREVKIFGINDNGVFIESGLEEGDTIVAEGAAYLK